MANNGDRNDPGNWRDGDDTSKQPVFGKKKPADGFPYENADQISKPVLNASAFSDIVNERIRQNAQWGGAEHDDSHSISAWPTFIARQIARGHQDCSEIAAEPGLSIDEYVKRTTEAVRERLVKIAALAISGIESIDRKAGK